MTIETILKTNVAGSTTIMQCEKSGFGWSFGFSGTSIRFGV